MKAIDQRTSWPWVGLAVSLVLVGCASRGRAAPGDRRRTTANPDRARRAQEKDRERQEPAAVRVLPVAGRPVRHASLCEGESLVPRLTFELRANDDDYDGYLQTDPVSLLGMPQRGLFIAARHGCSRKSEPTLAMQVMIPAANGLVPKELAVDMVRQNALRPDASWQATLSTLPPHQMLVLILSKDATNKFAAWNRMSAIIPSSAERDGGDIEKLRYYRLVLPIEADKPALSSHPLTWTTISHIDLGRLSARHAHVLAAASTARLASLGRATRALAAERASRFRSCARVSWALTCRPMPPARPSPSRGRPSAACAIVSSTQPPHLDSRRSEPAGAADHRGGHPARTRINIKRRCRSDRHRSAGFTFRS